MTENVGPVTARIDHWLATTVTDRTMMSVSEVQDMLLDLRLIACSQTDDRQLAGTTP